MTTRDPAKLYPHDHLMRYSLVPLVPQFVTPNMVTIFRMIMTPLVLWFLYAQNFAIGAPLFLFVALTDALDGSLARIRKQITDWGTMYDPIADKLLIGSVVLLVVMQHVNLYLGIAILLVEVVLVAGGVIRKRMGKKVTANVYGKIKMILQVVGVMLLLIALWAGYSLFIPISAGTLGLAIIFAIISMFTYGL